MWLDSDNRLGADAGDPQRDDASDLLDGDWHMARARLGERRGWGVLAARE